MLRIVAIPAVLAIVGSSCYRVRPLPLTHLAADPPAEVYVTAGGTAQRVQRPQVVRDTLLGHGAGGPVSIPLRNVSTVEVRKLDGTRTGAFIVGVLGAGALIVYERYDDFMQDTCGGDACQDVAVPKYSRPDGY